MKAPADRNNVWLASYPKSGNTWMRLALTSLRSGGGAIDFARPEGGIGRMLAFRKWLDDTLDVDSSDLSTEEVLLLRPKVFAVRSNDQQPLTIWKIHDRWERSAAGEALFPAEATRTAIYLVRDPRDVAVSFAHHFGLCIDQVLSLMADPDYRVADKPGAGTHHVPQTYSSWSDHVESWLDRSELAPFVVRYEEMLSDLGSILKTLAPLLDLPSSETAIERAVAATRFELLQNQERAVGFTEQPQSGRAFFRQGLAGGWRDALTPSQTARIERDHGKVMRRLGYL